MGFSIVLPFLAVYLKSNRHIPATWIGAVYTLSGIIGALTQAVAGELSDRHGRRNLMVGSLVVRSGILAAMGVAIVRDASFFTIGALVIANATVRSLFEPAAFAAVCDVTSVEQRVRAFGVQRIGINVGWAAGPALGGYLAHVGYGYLFFLAVPATLAAAFLCSGMKDVSAPRAGQERFSLRDLATLRQDRHLLPFLGVTLVGMILVAQIFSPFAMYADEKLHLGQTNLGHLYSINGVLVAALQVPAVWFIERIGQRRAVVLGPLAFAVGYTLIGVVHAMPGLIFCIVFLTLAEIVLMPAQQSIASRLGDASRQGRVMGLYGLTFAAGQSFGPLVGGLAVDHLIRWPLAMWGSLGMIGVVSAIGYAIVLRQTVTEGSASTARSASHARISS
jgi:MFS family permease